jgi:hypothetical protein
MTKIHMDERDLAHLMAVKHGAAIMFVEDGARFLRINVERLPIVEVIYPEAPAWAYSIEEEAVNNLLELMKNRPLYRDGNILRLSKPFKSTYVIT